MGRQRKFPKRENKRNPQGEKNKMNEMEATKTQDVEFKTMVIRTLKDLRGRMDGISENLSKR